MYVSMTIFGIVNDIRISLSLNVLNGVCVYVHVLINLFLWDKFIFLLINLCYCEAHDHKIIAGKDHRFTP